MRKPNSLFLNNGCIMADGINADRFAEDYKRLRRHLSGTDTLNIKLAPGGGWVAIATPNP
ncbi:hypothetical protein GF407_04260 [candidate division KSB1 bacterium]|nr:hypothetical protein [candidate division KSB1 bacterium]